jgi:hypothetical protein
MMNFFILFYKLINEFNEKLQKYLSFKKDDIYSSDDLNLYANSNHTKI